LYEAAGEGLLLGLVLLVLWRLTRNRPLPLGRYAVVFLAGYAVIRWSIEFIREPDAHIGIAALGMTMGQLLSLGLLVGAIAMFVVQKASRPPIRPAGAP
jgi:phosphatidylglycerol:prolipoprotein diacylglycerol transferase